MRGADGARGAPGIFAVFFFFFLGGGFWGGFGDLGLYWALARGSLVLSYHDNNKDTISSAIDPYSGNFN